MRVIDEKFHIEGDKIIKTTNGQEVPMEEPLCVFRGRDYLVIPLMEYYRQLCVLDGCNDHQMDLIDHRIEMFRAFARDYPERMKQPGITRGL